jgi:hypothetical protein
MSRIDVHCKNVMEISSDCDNKEVGYNLVELDD